MLISFEYLQNSFTKILAEECCADVIDLFVTDTKDEVDEAKRAFDRATIRKHTFPYVIFHINEMLILLALPSQASRKRPKMWMQT